jgi:hypothetical protein
MSMEKHDERLESFLREFEPRRPRDLPTIRIAEPTWARRIAAAAVLALALGTSAWLLSRKLGRREAEMVAKKQPSTAAGQTRPHALSLVALTRLAVEDPARFEAALAAASRDRLPRFDRADSALRVLAKE